jgi:hypothetical protein
MVTVWESANNVLGRDFNLYSSWADVLGNTKAWTFCDYDDVTNQIGAFRDCGPSGKLNYNWISNKVNGLKTGIKDYQFSVLSLYPNPPPPPRVGHR